MYIIDERPVIIRERSTPVLNEDLNTYAMEKSHGNYQIVYNLIILIGD